MPDVGANTAAMIDFLVLRYKQDTTLGRAKLLSILQACELEIWGLRNWWFKQELTTLVTEAGTPSYTIDAPCSDVLLITNSGTPIEFVHPNVFSRLFTPYASIAGAPQFWSFLPSEFADTKSVIFYPTPDDALSLSVIKEKRANVLEDSSASESALPLQHRMVLIECALQRLERLEGQIEASQEQAASYGPLMQAMLEEDNRQPKVTRQ